MLASESVLSRIKKLLAISNDDRANPNEAATAAAMARKLLDKYNLDEKDVILEDLSKNDDAIEEQTVGMAYRPGKIHRQIPMWVNQLAVAVSRFYDCEIRLYNQVHQATGKVQQVLRFYGYRTDLPVAVWAFDYLSAAIFRNTPKGVGIAASNAFRTGASTMICARLATLKAAEAEPSTGTSLVVVKSDKIKAKFGDMKYRQPKSDLKKFEDETYASSFIQGSEYGKSVNLSTNALNGREQPKSVQ